MPAPSWPKVVVLLTVLALTAAAALLTDPARLAAGPPGGRGSSPEPWSEVRLSDEARARDREARDRLRINSDLVRGLIDGRFSFPEAAALYWENNRGVRGFATLLERVWGTVPPEVAARLNLLRLVRQGLEKDPARRAEVTARLIAEYEGAYGSFPLAAPDDLDR